MNPLEIRDLLLEGVHDYACLMVDAPQEISDFLQDWSALNIPQDVLFVDEDGGKGREDEFHITVKYGLTVDEVPEEIRTLCQNIPPFPIYIGSVSLFKNPDFDVVKLDIESPWLRFVNAEVSRLVPNEDTHQNYTAHLTLAYVRKGTCDQLEGEDPFASGEVGREFKAPGMVFHGPGDSDDPERKEETLLFSRIAQGLAMQEAVIVPNSKSMQVITQIITQARDEAHGDVELFCALAGEGLKQFGIVFDTSAEMVMAGSPAEADDEGIKLRSPSEAQLRSAEFVAQYRTMIYHELVHTGQMQRMDDPELICANATEYVMPNGRLNQDRYTQQKQEVMAWAASLVDSWRAQGLNQEQMNERLKSGHWGFAEKYYYNRQRLPKTFNLFVRYCSDYINNQSVEEAIDPKAALMKLKPPLYALKYVDSDGAVWWLGKEGDGWLPPEDERLKIHMPKDNAEAVLSSFRETHSKDIFELGPSARAVGQAGWFPDKALAFRYTKEEADGVIQDEPVGHGISAEAVFEAIDPKAALMKLRPHYVITATRIGTDSKWWFTHGGYRRNPEDAQRFATRTEADAQMEHERAANASYGEHDFAVETVFGSHVAEAENIDPKRYLLRLSSRVRVMASSHGFTWWIGKDGNWTDSVTEAACFDMAEADRQVNNCARAMPEWKFAMEHVAVGPDEIDESACEGTKTPFDGMEFPADASEIKRFKRQRKRRPRQVL